MNIVFFGDSIIFGQHVSPCNTWVTNIAQKLHHELADKCDLRVYNLGVSGNTTRMALDRMPFDVQSIETDIIFIQFGINDCNLWETDKGLPRVSKKSFEANLLEIIERSRVFGTKKIFINTNHPTDKKIKDVRLNRILPHNDGNKEYNHIIRQVASISKLCLIDMENVFNEQVRLGVPLQKFLMDDGIHLSQSGHDLYFNSIYKSLRKACDDLVKNN